MYIHTHTQTCVDESFDTLSALLLHTIATFLITLARVLVSLVSYVRLLFLMAEMMIQITEMTLIKDNRAINADRTATTGWNTAGLSRRSDEKVK